MKAEIIRLLKSCDGYLSGQELCEKLNVSRTAVWKVINQLREEGYEIEAVRNKGYRLVESADVMTAAELESCMGDQQLGLPVKYYDKIDSTNNQVRRLAEEGAEEGAFWSWQNVRRQEKAAVEEYGSLLQEAVSG